MYFVGSVSSNWDCYVESAKPGNDISIQTFAEKFCDYVCILM
jgi:hypothetical protein